PRALPEGRRQGSVARPLPQPGRRQGAGRDAEVRLNTAELIARAQRLAARDGRALLGITGAPGAGKSSLATVLAAAVAGPVVVPMDGFHRTTAQLAANGWVAEGGTPRTIAASAYVALLRRFGAGGDGWPPARG